MSVAVTDEEKIGLTFFFCYRAYMHQYIKFGISEEDFLDSFTSLEQVISSYRQLQC